MRRDGRRVLLPKRPWVAAMAGSVARCLRFDWREMAQRLYDHVPAAEELLELEAHLAELAELESGDERREQLDKMHSKVSWYEQLFQDTRRARLKGEAEPAVDWDLIAQRINKRFKYKPMRSAFVPERYASYEDWFLRGLAPKTRERCLQRARSAEVCAPVQGKLWPQAHESLLLRNAAFNMLLKCFFRVLFCMCQVLSGEITLKISVLCVEHLLRLLGAQQLLQLRLRWPDYHRVHCPVDGLVVALHRYAKDELFPTAAARPQGVLWKAFQTNLLKN